MIPVLVLVPGFPADESDSSCLPAVQNYVEALAGRMEPGAVEVIAFQYPYERRSYRWRGVRVNAMGGGNSRIAKLCTWLQALRTGVHIIAGRRRGVIHSFWLGECALVGSLLARRHGWRHVVSIGGQEVRRVGPYGALLRFGTFSVTAGSIPAAAAARRVLHRNVEAVIPLGLDADRLASIAKTAAEDGLRHIDILSVGSLTRLKRTEDVIDVAARLVARHSDLAVHIVGDGPERARIQRRITESGLDDHVILRGWLPREEVLRLMRTSRILLHPAEYESQGYVLLEALASGTFVVCRNVGFHPESPNVEHAASVDEMASAVERRLVSIDPPVPVHVPTAEETVDAFLKLYSA